MIHQPAQNQPGCPAALEPDALHIDLPHADPEKVYFTILKCLVQISPQHWEFIRHGLVTGAAMTVLASSCMDMIQVFAEAILDVLMPQVYRYMKTYSTFSVFVLGLTEDRIHSYLGDSIERGLAKALDIKVQHFEATKKFYQLLLRHISKAVNSVLALTTQAPTFESMLPVFFVSGCVTSTGELFDIVRQFATILTEALKVRQRAMWNLNESYEPGRFVLTPYFYFQSKSDLNELVKAYISRMVKILKSAQMPNCVTSSSDHKGVCIRVGTNTQMLTVEDMDSDGQESAMSSCCDSDGIPGAVPDSGNTESNTESCPFSSATVIAAHHSGPNEMESIKNIADELVQAFSAEDLPGSVQGDSSQSVHSGLDVKDKGKLRELTDRIFNLVMSGHDYQIPIVAVEIRMCDIVTYGKLRGEGLIAHALYLRTEEVVTRCAMQVQLWSEVYSEQLDSEEFSVSDNSIFGPRIVVGDHLEEVVESSTSSSLSQDISDSNMTYEVNDELHHDLFGVTVPQGLMTLLVEEMLTVIGINNIETVLHLTSNAIIQLEDGDLREHFHFGRSYKAISQAVIRDLLELSSLQELQEAVRSMDPGLKEAILRALKKQETVLQQKEH
ncbi:uncharacterized protein LOC131991521 [Centropristis striata]|uniref:uncharacterized protein LOC131991521 n=1 Tax=Centropristis striata TaxID=184440 RepID=UPI0027E133AA|nr:uncharacterized protein LOC131991521 [Centropristis striata]